MRVMWFMGVCSFAWVAATSALVATVRGDFHLANRRLADAKHHRNPDAVTLEEAYAASVVDLYSGRLAGSLRETISSRQHATCQQSSPQDWRPRSR
jgi:hypothetical protein